MANKKIERADLVAPDAITSVIAELGQMETKLKDLLKTYEQLLKTNPLKSSEDVRKLKDDIEGIAIASKNLESTTKTLNETKKAYNKELAEEVATSKKVEQQLNDINGTLEQNIKLQTRRKLEIKSLKDEQAELNKRLKIGAISELNYLNATASLNKEIQELTVANSKLGFTIKAQIKEGQAALTSFDQQAQRLGQLRTAYRKLSQEERENINVGGVLLESIKALDGQVKANDASIGNFQRNVGDYRGAITDAARETGFFAAITNKLTQVQKTYAAAQAATTVAVGASTGALRIFKLALISTGIGAIVVALGSLIAFFLQTQKGAEIVSKAFAGLGAIVDVLIDRFSLVGEALADLFSGDFTGAANKFKAATKGVTEEIVKETKAALKLKEALIEVEKVENDLILKRAATRAEVKELNKIAEDTTKSFKERSDAAREAINIEQKLLDEQLNAQKKRAANLLGELDLTDKRLEEIRKNGLKLSEIGLANSTEDERKAAIEEVAKIFALQEESLELQTTLNNKLNTIEEQRKNKRIKEQKAASEAQKKASEDLLNIIKDAEKELDEDKDDAAFAAIQRETEILKAKRDIREEDLAENQEYLDKLLEQTEEANQKKVKDEQKTAEELRKEREKGVDDAIAIINTIGDSLQTVSQKRLKSLDQETTKQAEELSRQERRAEQGLENDLANQEKRAAELSRQREEEAKKAERTQKALAYFAQFQELSKENPNTAAFKAAANVAIAETIAALFYDGAENIDDKTAHKWRNTGKDDFIIGVHGGERVLTATQNSKIGDISNEDLANIAVQYRTGNLGSVVPIMDDRVVSRLESVEKAVKNIHFDIYIDPDSNVTKTEFKNGLKKISTTKRKRLR